MSQKDAVVLEQLHWLKDELVEEVEQDEKMHEKIWKDGKDALDEGLHNLLEVEVVAVEEDFHESEDMQKLDGEEVWSKKHLQQKHQVLFIWSVVHFDLNIFLKYIHTGASMLLHQCKQWQLCNVCLCNFEIN